jgi:hypothetical protein
MMADDATPKKTMPKGGRKGGSVFPRYALDDAVGWAKRLVSKTHVEAQPVDVIFAGVVGAKSGTGNIRISTLKQYGFLQGDPKGYSATPFAKQMDAAPSDEILPLKQEAVLKPGVFRALYTTFQGDAVPRPKLKQRAAELKVHPDETETCVQIYVTGLVSAGLATVDGDKVVHVPSSSLVVERMADVTAEQFEPTGEDETVPDDAEKTPQAADLLRRPRAVFNVSVSLDSSLDTEKLERQLALLKRYGAI